jgi:CHAD domain-containing protein
MKARRVDLSQACGVDDAMRRVAIVRFAEVLTQAPAFRRARSEDIHALRIACKRLRYTLERFAVREPGLVDAVGRLTQLQNALGEVHDRDVLRAIVPHQLHRTLARVDTERAEAVARALALWRDAFAPYGPFEGLMRFTGLGYGLGEGEAGV